MPFYLYYLTWLVPVLLPVWLAIAWRASLSSPLAFAVVGIFAGVGANWVGALVLGIPLGWIDAALGLTDRSRVLARIWFNEIFMLVASTLIAYFVLRCLRRILGGKLDPVGAQRPV